VPKCAFADRHRTLDAAFDQVRRENLFSAQLVAGSSRRARSAASRLALSRWYSEKAAGTPEPNGLGFSAAGGGGEGGSGCGVAASGAAAARAAIASSAARTAMTSSIGISTVCSSDPAYPFVLAFSQAQPPPSIQRIS
jgi:hypothetical protein